jgi:hypothetical protein
MAFSAEYVSKGPWVKLKPLRNAEQRLLAVSGGQKKKWAQQCCAPTTEMRGRRTKVV